MGAKTVTYDFERLINAKGYSRSGAALTERSIWGRRHLTLMKSCQPSRKMRGGEAVRPAHSANSLTPAVWIHASVYRFTCAQRS